MAAAGRVARVVLDSPLPQLDHFFDYTVPDELAAEAVPGVRVRVPLRTAGRIADGYLVELADAGEGFEGSLSPIEAVVSPVPVLTPGVWTLARRLADRSAGTASDILRLAVPSRMVRAEKTWLALPEDQRVPAPRPPAFAVRGYGDGVLEAAVSRDERLALQVIPRLSPLPDGTWVGEWAITLAALAAACWAGGRTAIVAVPDHRDLDQLATALAAVAPPEAV
ncbi:hypothetical protein N136_02577, partial [Leifsonia aquatica ATCC 14665]